MSINDSTTEELQWTIYDIIKTIKDPEKPNNLEVGSRCRLILKIMFIGLFLLRFIKTYTASAV